MYKEQNSEDHQSRSDSSPVDQKESFNPWKPNLLLSADVPGTPSLQTNLHYSLNSLPWCHWANNTKASGLIIKRFLHCSVLMLSVAGAVSSLLQGQKCNSKPKITGCGVKQQQAPALCLCCRAVARVCRTEGNALCVFMGSHFRAATASENDEAQTHGGKQRGQWSASAHMFRLLELLSLFPLSG